MAEPEAVSKARDILESERKHIGHSADYYITRLIMLDVRGSLEISPLSRWGYKINVWTLSHSANNFSKTVDRPVIVDDYAWICSNVVLYNCHIGEGSIVGCGTIVANRDVPDWTMVEGNPAQIIARFDHDEQKWNYLEMPEPIKPKSNQTKNV